MADALLRHWHLLEAMPRAPAKRDVSSLHQDVTDAVCKITRRQFQRDPSTRCYQSCLIEAVL
jgi:hypothetical protein